MLSEGLPRIEGQGDLRSPSLSHHLFSLSSREHLATPGPPAAAAVGGAGPE